jgi:N-acetylglucosaminyl-diphospho-decaprenol L-rhamnosyltransferase
MSSLPLDLGIVIVTWNIKDFVLQALQSLVNDLESSNLTSHIVVVDNASHDGTPEAIRETFPQVLVIDSGGNLGFGRANNIGIRAFGFGTDIAADMLPRAVYLLNPDTITQSGATRALYEGLFSDSDIGLAGAHLLNEDGSFQHGAFGFPGLRQLWAEFFPTPGRFLEGRFNGRYPRAWYEGTALFEVDFTLGATMMMRREVVQQTKGFDESFFMYAEEVDWGWRIHNAGWRAVCVPMAKVVHLVGQSTGQVKPRSTMNLWESRMRLFCKYYPRWKERLARLMIRIGIGHKYNALQHDSMLSTADRTAMQEAYQRVLEMAKTGVKC